MKTKTISGTCKTCGCNFSYDDCVSLIALMGISEEEEIVESTYDECRTCVEKRQLIERSEK